MRRRWTPVLLMLVSVAAGCASKWTLNAEQSPIALQWPYQPAKAKLVYLRSLKGLVRSSDAGATVSAVVFGTAREDPNTFLLPVAVATGRDGRIAVADMGRRCVHLYIPAEQRYVRLTGSEQRRLASPVAVIFDDALRLYVSDSTGRVLAFDPGGALLFALEEAGGTPLQRPTGLAYSPDRGLLYVVDTVAGTVYAFRWDGAFAFSFGERGFGEGRFNFPTHIFRAPSGELYVTDSLNFRIAIFDQDGKQLSSFGHHGDGSGDLAMPKGVAVDRDGVVYVVDGLFDNVQLFDRQGRFLLTLGKRGVDAGEFWLPSGIFLGANDELYVCDAYNRRIQVFHIMERYADAAS